MASDITDLNTFYIGPAPALNAQKLSTENPEPTDDKLRQGNFADSMEVLYGIDCFQVIQKLITTNRFYTVIENRILPATFILLRSIDRHDSKEVI